MYDTRNETNYNCSVRHRIRVNHISTLVARQRARIHSVQTALLKCLLDEINFFKTKPAMFLSAPFS